MSARSSLDDSGGTKFEMNYHGGKNGSGVYQRLIGMMPPHDVYVEAFLGSGAILRRKRPARLSIAYELDRKTIAEIIKHLPPEHFQPSPINAEWNGVGDLPGCGGTSLIFEAPPGEDGERTFRTNLEIFNVDAFEALRNKYVASSYFWGLHDPAEVLIYCDPPYPSDVRSSKDRRYNFEMMAESEHSEFCDLLLAIPCKVMVSGYENDLYNRKLKGWRKETIPTTNRAGTKVIETVWLNFPAPVELHDYSHAGDNFRDRWRITKRLRNWTGQLERMSAAERGAMLEQLAASMDVYNAAGKLADQAATKRRQTTARKAEKAFSRRPTTPKKTSPTAADLFEGEK